MSPSHVYTLCLFKYSPHYGVSEGCIFAVPDLCMPGNANIWSHKPNLDILVQNKLLLFESILALKSQVKFNRVILLYIKENCFCYRPFVHCINGYDFTASIPDVLLVNTIQFYYMNSLRTDQNIDLNVASLC